MTSALVPVHDAKSYLAALDAAKHCLAACSSVDEAKVFRDKAAAIQVWARAQKDATELEITAGDIRVRATARMGELLGEPSRSPGRGNKSSHADTISRMEASRARTLAAVPATIREKAIADGGATKLDAPYKVVFEIISPDRAQQIIETTACKERPCSDRVRRFESSRLQRRSAPATA